MIVVADPNTHAVMIKQRMQLGLADVAYVGSNTAVQPQTLDLLTGGEAKGIYALTSSVPPEDPDPDGQGLERRSTRPCSRSTPTTSRPTHMTPS